jgi:hypothetical protein
LRRQLIEQRLGYVVIAVVDHYDLGVAQRVRSRDAGAEDRDALPRSTSLSAIGPFFDRTSCFGDGPYDRALASLWR